MGVFQNLISHNAGCETNALCNCKPQFIVTLHEENEVVSVSENLFKFSHLGLHTAAQ